MIRYLLLEVGMVVVVLVVIKGGKWVGLFDEPGRGRGRPWLFLKMTTPSSEEVAEEEEGKEAELAA